MPLFGCRVRGRTVNLTTEKYTLLQTRYLRHFGPVTDYGYSEETPMRRISTLIVVIGLFASLATPQAMAQTKSELERKIVEKVAPVYPPLAKRMNIKGVVKLEVVVRANGTVKSTKIVGGNPVLIDSATDAVRKWKFEPAPAESTGVVEVVFEPR
jgi:TonB family protein